MENNMNSINKVLDDIIVRFEEEKQLFLSKTSQAWMQVAINIVKSMKIKDNTREENLRNVELCILEYEATLNKNRESPKDIDIQKDLTISIKQSELKSLIEEAFMKGGEKAIYLTIDDLNRNGLIVDRKSLHEIGFENTQSLINAYKNLSGHIDAYKALFNAPVVDMLKKSGFDSFTQLLQEHESVKDDAERYRYVVKEAVVMYELGGVARIGRKENDQYIDSRIISKGDV
jgi:hypothetical protein